MSNLSVSLCNHCPNQHLRTLQLSEYRPNPRYVLSQSRIPSSNMTLSLDIPSLSTVSTSKNYRTQSPEIIYRLGSHIELEATGAKTPDSAICVGFDRRSQVVVAKLIHGSLRCGTDNSRYRFPYPCQILRSTIRGTSRRLGWGHRWNVCLVESKRDDGL
jgi:hypothetical protein